MQSRPPLQEGPAAAFSINDRAKDDSASTVWFGWTRTDALNVQKRSGGARGCDVCTHVTSLWRWIKTQRQEFQSPALKAVILSAPHTAAAKTLLYLSHRHICSDKRRKWLLFTRKPMRHLCLREGYFFFFSLPPAELCFPSRAFSLGRIKSSFSTKDETTAGAATEDTTNISFTFTSEVASKERS